MTRRERRGGSSSKRERDKSSQDKIVTLPLVVSHGRQGWVVLLVSSMTSFQESSSQFAGSSKASGPELDGRGISIPAAIGKDAGGSPRSALKTSTSLKGSGHRSVTFGSSEFAEKADTAKADESESPRGSVAARAAMFQQKGSGGSPRSSAPRSPGGVGHSRAKSSGVGLRFEQQMLQKPLKPAASPRVQVPQAASPELHRRMKTTSVSDRIKALAALESNDDDEDDASPSSASSKPQRNSLEALKKGSKNVGQLRNFLQGAGFDPSSGPPSPPPVQEENDVDDEGSVCSSGEGQDPPLASPSTPTPNHRPIGSYDSSASPCLAASLRPSPVRTYTGTEHAAAVVMQSVMRVMVARSIVRRKLVGEANAFAIIMNKGINVIKYPYGARAKPKKVLIQFAKQKGKMNLIWGGRHALPLEDVHGLLKGIQTKALQRSLEPKSADQCFSFVAKNRTVDFQAHNPWLVLLAVRAMRLYLGAHFNTIAPPKFFSPLLLRQGPRNASRPAVHSLVWTEGDTPKKRTRPGALHTDALNSGDHQPALLSSCPGAEPSVTPAQSSAKKRGHARARTELGDSTRSFMSLPGESPKSGSPKASHVGSPMWEGATEITGSGSPRSASPKQAMKAAISAVKGSGSKSQSAKDEKKKWQLSFSITAGYRTAQENEEREEELMVMNLNSKLKGLRKMVGHVEEEEVTLDQTNTLFGHGTGLLSGKHHPSPRNHKKNKSKEEGEVKWGGSSKSVDDEAASEDPDREKKKFQFLVNKSNMHKGATRTMLLSPRMLAQLEEDSDVYSIASASQAGEGAEDTRASI
ncbi:unnamed protein product [Chrysoparadoxa australica]